MTKKMVRRSLLTHPVPGGTKEHSRKFSRNFDTFFPRKGDEKIKIYQLGTLLDSTPGAEIKINVWRKV